DLNQHKTDYIEHLSSAGHMSNRDKELFAINRDDVVFIFVDLQEGLIRKSKTMEPNALSSNTAGLAQVAHAISAPALFFYRSSGG
ncbi:isochorismatase, partial [Klebsiella pneumoniae]|nr:isochorismatase [Klebsiella pneumoniae]